ncbi:conserved hypothetical protein [Desulfarculus baarsii DSM 2075]|uniref:Regulatory protein GemA n=1 Tax=Desulfarculus baarsii (strain ATCC 33931 / DSM 2075 / LMG 7858 / VKM B-1802 / 2st14) TaxID=644282 RepID=E1QHC7_DESB2|nr:regulatory protein GemA [Desulfarculus baarsii]ADK84970.1 conserved hypothetical protein [Desulfarculus baarsii DSM 2075]
MDRNAMLAKIHIGRKTMGWDEDAYRDVLRGRYGVDSAAKLKPADLADMCAYLAGQGVSFKPAAKAKEKARWYAIPDRTPHCQQKRYIAALWRALGWKASGLDTRCKKQFGVDKFLWLHDQDKLQILAKDLHNRCKKRGIDPTPC